VRATGGGLDIEEVSFMAKSETSTEIADELARWFFSAGDG
jgi:hypothetical protein